MLSSVHMPSNLEAVFDALAGFRGSAILAGGTLLMAECNSRAGTIEALISTRRLGISGVSITEGHATIGAATTLDAFGRDERLSVLHAVIESIASPPIRNMATVGGNLFVRQPYGDLAVALLALDATVQVAARSGPRTVSIEHILRDGVAAGEIVTDILFKIPDPRHWFYTKAMRRKSNSAAIVSVAAWVELDQDVVRRCRIALGGCGRRPVRAPSVEAALLGRPLDVANVDAAAEKAVADIAPFTDAYATAWYRSRTLPIHIRRALCGV
jgi:CO/xanthine dehydrogenase FAD-binding subunit